MIYCCLVDRKEHLDGTTARTAVWGRHGDRDGIRHVLLHADSVSIGLIMVFGDLGRSVDGRLDGGPDHRKTATSSRGGVDLEVAKKEERIANPFWKYF